MGRHPPALVLLALLLPLGVADAAAGAPPHVLLMVSFDDAPPAVGALLGGARVVDTFPAARLAIVEAPATAARSLAALPGVAGVYADEAITLAMERERALVEADPPAGASWPSGSNVTVALVDSGIDASHPAFAGRVEASVRISRVGVVSGEAGDSDGHGTHVAGIVGGDGTGSLHGRHRGIAPGAHLVGVDISDSFTTTNAVRAFAWISENAERYGIRVVSNSWGREKDAAHYDANDPVIRASDALVAQGLVVVFSAGNRGRDGDGTLTTEAMNPNVITVAAANGAGRAESYSSRGPAVDAKGRALSWTKPDLSAPGTAVVSARASALAAEGARSDEERYYTVMNGTSMAAPQVAAAAALLLDLQPDLTPAEVQALLQRSAADLGTAGADSDTGYGMLDVAAALRDAAYLTAGERRIVVETRVPVREEGSLAAAAGAILLAGSAPRLPPDSATSIPLVLPPGAAGFDLWFNWTSEGSFDVRFLGPDGPVPFHANGAKSLRLSTASSPGAWRVEAVPTGPASYTAWALAGSILVREERLVEVAAEPNGQRGGGNQAFFGDAGSEIRPLEVLADAPLLVLALVATGVTGGAVAWRLRRRS